MTNKITQTKEPIVYVTFEEGVTQVRKEVEKKLTSSPLIIRSYMQHLKNSSGKYIRTISLLACAENDKGLIHPDAITLAASIEILHLATLVHDDVIDNADIRRGLITLQKKYGKRTAVICGDYLFCLALNMASTVSDRNEYLEVSIPDYMGRVCLGELNQHVNNGNLDLSTFQYLRIISGKTAALFEAAFYTGGILSKCESEELKKYKLLGQYIGMIFQLTDDCIDFEKTEDVAKKPVQSDYEQGVITLPLIHALSKLTDLKKRAKEKHILRKDINEAVERAGGLPYTKGVSQKYYSKAWNILEQLKISNGKRERLREILEKACGKVQ